MSSSWVTLWATIPNLLQWDDSPSRTLEDATTGGALMGKNLEDAYELLKEMAVTAYQWPIERNIAKKPLRVHELDVLNTLSSQIASISKQVRLLIT